MGFLVDMQSLWLTELCLHYRAAPLQWPDAAEKRTWYVKGADGKDHKIRADTREELRDRILNVRPLRIEYGTQDAAGKFLETPFFVEGGRRAVVLASWLQKDYGLKSRDIQVISDGSNDVTVLAQGGPFTNIARRDVERFYAYFQGEELRTEMPAQGGMTRHYQDSLAKTLASWRAMDRVQLLEHLRRETPLGPEADRVVRFIHENDDASALLGAFPELQRHLHARATEGILPRPRLRRPNSGVRVQLVGSMNALTGHVVRNLLEVRHG